VGHCIVVGRSEYTDGRAVTLPIFCVDLLINVLDDHALDDV